MVKIYTFRIGEAFDRYKTSQGYLIPVSMIEAFERKNPKYSEIFNLAYGYGG